MMIVMWFTLLLYVVWCSLKIPMNDTNGMSAAGAKRFEKTLGKYFMAPHGIQCSHRIQCCNIVHCDSFHILPPSQWGRCPLFETPDPGLRKEVFLLLLRSAWKWWTGGWEIYADLDFSSANETESQVCWKGKENNVQCSNAHFLLKKKKSRVCFRLSIYCESVQPCDWLCLQQPTLSHDSSGRKLLPKCILT